MEKHLLKDHLAIYNFAKFKHVTIKAVEEASERGEIEICLIGMNKFKLIDMRKYMDFEFNPSPPRPSKFGLWLLRLMNKLSHKRPQNK